MSIYATLWKLKFPKDGDDFIGCDWIEVTAQGVPPPIGSPSPGSGYESGDPYAAFCRCRSRLIRTATRRTCVLWFS
jgi:hypothetical protein